MQAFSSRLYDNGFIGLKSGTRVQARTPSRLAVSRASHRSSVKSKGRGRKKDQGASMSNPLLRQAAEQAKQRKQQKDELLEQKRLELLSPALKAYQNRLARSDQEVKKLQQYRCLVLDSHYRPIGVVSWKRAVIWDYFEKVQALEYYDYYIRSSLKHQLPAVVRLKGYVDDHFNSSIRATKRNVFIRDRFTCQYCQSRTGLTIDHVIPIARGGTHTWENVVCCCDRCNVRKSFRTPQEMGWDLIRKPKAPNPQEALVYCSIIHSILQPPLEWRQYLFPLATYFLQVEGLDRREVMKHMGRSAAN